MVKVGDVVKVTRSEGWDRNTHILMMPQFSRRGLVTNIDIALRPFPLLAIVVVTPDVSGGITRATMVPHRSMAPDGVVWFWEEEEDGNTVGGV